MTDTNTENHFLDAIKAASVSNPGAQRLAAALVDSRRAIREAEERGRPGETAAAVARAMALYTLACDLKAAPAFLAWDCLQQIERELMWVATPEELRIVWASYLKEARAKLKNWRLSAVEDLDQLLRPPQPIPPGTPGSTVVEEAQSAGGEVKAPVFTPTVAGLQALMRHVHAASQNRQHKLNIIEKQVHIITALLLFVIGWTLGLAFLGKFDWMEVGAETSLISVLPDGVLAGAFGALLSVAFKLSGADSTDAVPDMRSLNWVTAARLAIGTGAAFPVLVVMSAGFMNFPGQAAKIYLALCVIAGFSERWFRTALEAVASRTQPAAPAAPVAPAAPKP